MPLPTLHDVAVELAKHLVDFLLFGLLACFQPALAPVGESCYTPGTCGATPADFPARARRPGNPHMKRSVRNGLFAAFVLSAASLSALVAGCESGDSYSISVSPNYAKVKPGQSVVLNASGWSNYQWTLDNENGAHLSATTGKSVVFYAESSSNTNKASSVYNVTATAVGSGSSGSGTNSTSSAGYTAKAKIVVQ